MLNSKFLINVIYILIGVFAFVFLNKLLGIAIILGTIVTLAVPWIFMVRGNSANYSGKVDKAMKYYRRAADSPFSSTKVKITYGYMAVKNGHIDEAEKGLEKLKDISMNVQDEIKYKFTYGIVLWKKGKIDEAIEMLFKVYEKYKTTSVYENLGYFLILQGDYDKAVSFNEEGYEYNTSAAGILDNLALSYYMKGDHKKANEIYQKLMEMKPDFVTAYYYYALLLIEQKDYEKALVNLKRATKCKFSFISFIQKEEIEEKIKEVEELAKNE